MVISANKFARDCYDSRETEEVIDLPCRQIFDHFRKIVSVSNYHHSTWAALITCWTEFANASSAEAHQLLSGQSCNHPRDLCVEGACATLVEALAEFAMEPATRRQL